MRQYELPTHTTRGANDARLAACYNVAMTTSLDTLLAHYSSSETRDTTALAQRLAHAEPDEIDALVHAAAEDEKLAELLPHVVLASPGEAGELRDHLTPETVAAVADWYARLGRGDRRRSHLLRLLASDGGPVALRAWAELVATDPPRENDEVDRAFVPLFQQREFAAEALFPRLLDAVAHREVAAAVLDTANYCTRQRLVDDHPARERAAALGELFGALLQQLERMTESPERLEQDAATLGRQLNETSALFIALCDAIALVGDPKLAAKLRPALGIGHRRLRTEAAAALARLGDEEGIAELLRLASEPVVRPRVLAYAEELDLFDRVPEQFRTRAARAAGELTAWLALPKQFGLPPQEIELVDETRQHWPGYEEPIDCFLFSYEYRLPGGGWSGLGIAGPLTLSLSVDLEDFPPSDIYDLYAGWQAEHEAISLVDAAELSTEDRTTLQRLAAMLAEAGYEQARLVKVGRFFDELHPIYATTRGNQSGHVVLDGQTPHWYPTGSASQPLTAELAYDMHKGRKLLRMFNPAPRAAAPEDVA
ncbi:MAG: HEAT repeat domain-containing protein [Pirellulales bacterium]|nr:HEAT repeat domain-containing protein [Pirellulales bacterium]